LKLDSLTIIGTGTLGAHLCKHLAESSEISKLILIDADTVDSKDISIGIFKQVDICQPKVHVLHDMFSTYDTEIEPRVEFYKDGITQLAPTDLIIDCRNVFGKRDINIDLKMFITERILILDFEKRFKNESQLKGEYSYKLSKHEISTAAHYATNLILCSNILEELLKSQSVKCIHIDTIKSIILQNICSSKQRYDIVYDLDKDVERLPRIHEVIQPILKKNRTSNLKLAVKERSSIAKNIFEFPDAPKTKYQIIPQNSLRQPEDVINFLKKIVQTKNGTSKLRPVLIHDEIYILSETGGA